MNALPANTIAAINALADADLALSADEVDALKVFHSTQTKDVLAELSEQRRLDGWNEQAIADEALTLKNAARGDIATQVKTLRLSAMAAGAATRLSDILGVTGKAKEAFVNAFRKAAGLSRRIINAINYAYVKTSTARRLTALAVIMTVGIGVGNVIAPAPDSPTVASNLTSVSSNAPKSVLAKGSLANPVVVTPRVVNAKKTSPVNCKTATARAKKAVFKAKVSPSKSAQVKAAQAKRVKKAACAPVSSPAVPAEFTVPSGVKVATTDAEALKVFKAGTFTASKAREFAAFLKVGVSITGATIVDTPGDPMSSNFERWKYSVTGYSLAPGRPDILLGYGYDTAGNRVLKVSDDTSDGSLTINEKDTGFNPWELTFSVDKEMKYGAMRTHISHNGETYGYR